MSCLFLLCCEKLRNHFDIRFIVDIEMDNDARLQHLCNVLSKVRTDIMLQRILFLSDTSQLIQETLDHEEMKNKGFGKSEGK